MSETESGETVRTVLRDVSMRTLDTRGIRRMNRVLSGGYGGWESASMEYQDWIQPMVKSDGRIGLKFESATERWYAYWDSEEGFRSHAEQKYENVGAGGFVDWFTIAHWIDKAEWVDPILVEEVTALVE